MKMSSKWPNNPQLESDLNEAKYREIEGSIYIVIAIIHSRFGDSSTVPGTSLEWISRTLL